MADTKLSHTLTEEHHKLITARIVALTVNTDSGRYAWLKLCPAIGTTLADLPG